jgi:hypothetical protein
MRSKAGGAAAIVAAALAAAGLYAHSCGQSPAEPATARTHPEVLGTEPTSPARIPLAAEVPDAADSALAHGLSTAQPSDPAEREAALRAAQDIWSKLDAAPGRTSRTRGAARTRALLDTTLRRANAAAATLGEVDARAVHEFNAKELRRRFPALLSASDKATVRGADATIIVPSADPAQCRSLAESWLEGDVPRVLLDVGFSEIGCDADGRFTSWRLDGHL